MKDYSKYFKKQEPSLDIEQFTIKSQYLNLGNDKKYYIRTYGCQANERDTEVIAGILELMGYQKSDDYNNADFILFNTCAVRENAENKVFGEIGHLKPLKEKNPNLLFAICGCMSQEEAVVERLLTKHKHMDLIFGTHNLHRLPELIYQALTTKKHVVEIWDSEGSVVESLPSNRQSKIKGFVNIMYGCDKYCTYCIIPFTRGKERSRRLEDILAETRELKAANYQEITLLGQNVNAYGKDLDENINFATLLEKVAKIGINRIRFTTSHPWDFSDEMIEVIANNPNIMPYIHLPVQSGSDQILKLMGRKYTSEQYKTLFTKLKNKISNCAFSTDIIVGFPNETDAQFQMTLDLVDFCQFDNAYTFVYSPRIGTPAAKMKDNVEIKIKKDRLQQLNEKVNHYARLNNERYQDQIVEVLVDGFSKKSDLILSGYTKTNKLVNFAGNSNLIGKLVKVKITTVKTWSLDGELING